MNKIVSKNEGYAIAIETQKEIVALELQIKELKTKYENLKDQIKKEMVENGIIKIDTDAMLINYIQPSERESFNSKKFQEEHPDLFDEYVEFKPVKDSIRIKVR